MVCRRRPKTSGLHAWSWQAGSLPYGLSRSAGFNQPLSLAAQNVIHPVFAGIGFCGLPIEFLESSRVRPSSVVESHELELIHGQNEPGARAQNVRRFPLHEDGRTAYEARVTIDGAQVTVDLPGTHKTISDPRFSEWQGSFATFELYSNNGATDSIGAFEKIWATGNKD